MLAVWLSTNGVGRMSEVYLRRTRSIPGWVTVFWQGTCHLGM